MSQGHRIDQLRTFDMNKIADQLRIDHGEQSAEAVQDTSRSPQTPAHVQKYNEWVGNDGYMNRVHGLVLNEHLFGRAGDGTLTVQKSSDLGQSNGSNHPGSRNGPHVGGPRALSQRLGTAGYAKGAGGVGRGAILPVNQIVSGTASTGRVDPEVWYDINEARMHDISRGISRSPAADVVVAALEATQTDAVVPNTAQEDVLAQGPISKEATQVDKNFRSIFDQMGDEILIEGGEHGLPTGFVQQLEQEYTRTFAGTPGSRGKGFFGRLFT